MDPVGKDILSLEEAAQLFEVSVKTFIKLLKEEKVPARKIGREWRFSRKALVEWLSCGDSQAYSASESESKEFFDEIAPEWESLSRNIYDESARKKLLDSGVLKKGMIVLDLGSGDGYIARAAARHVKKVVAVDLSAAMLKELSRKAAAEGIRNIETLEGDALDIPLADSGVDVVCASMFLHHIDEPRQAIAEMHRLLKTEGTVFVSDFTEYADTGFRTQMHDAWPGFKVEELTRWFVESGFRDVRTEIIPGRSTGKNSAPNADKRRDVLILTAAKA